MSLSQMIARTESAMDQAIASGEPMNMATIAGIQEVMVHWSAEAQKLEEQLATSQAENANLRGLLKLPDDLPASVFSGNIVPVGTAP